MKPAIRYILLAGTATLAVVMIYFYREYMGEDSDSAMEKQANPVINRPLNAIVTDTSSSRRPTNSVQSPLNIVYTDLDSKETSSFRLNNTSRPDIAIGDTVTKEKGEKLLLVYKKGGIIVSVPIE